MCKHTCEQQQHELLDELDKREFKYSIDQNGRLYVLRKLPTDVKLPSELIPTHILRLHRQFQDGELTKERVGTLKHYDVVKLLRRYHLIDPPAKASLSPTEKRAKNRVYLREWRRSKRAVAA